MRSGEHLTAAPSRGTIVERQDQNAAPLAGRWFARSGGFSLRHVAWLLFKLAHFRETLRYLDAIVHSHADTRYILLACVLTYSAPVVLYYGWHLCERVRILSGNGMSS